MSGDIFDYARAIRRYEELCSKLEVLSGHRLTELVDLFVAGYTLEPPKENTMSMAELADEMEEGEE